MPSSRPVGLDSDSTSESTSTSGVSIPTPYPACAACGNPMQDAFVRALGALFHLECFKCMDCGTVVASKFFPIDGTDGKEHPLCERDYFRRLNLICAKCGMALRGSYITACVDKKFHVEHFTCSVCPTLFSAQDPYYEHDGDVYCHYHYSTRFATKCVGCNCAILKQFVEINRNSRDECWHPECYMMNKFWSVKVVPRRPEAMIASAADDGTENATVEPSYVEEEKKETPTSLKDKQLRTEQQVYRMWTVLSAFEESTAACISDMLRLVVNGQFLEAIRMGEKFILHVEVLFATIDDLEWQFDRLKTQGMSHVREARLLGRKTVELYTLLSHTQETGTPRNFGLTQELLALVTGVAHYLKILIRKALKGALKLEREYDASDAISSFLDKLHMLAIQGADPGAKRALKRANGEIAPQGDSKNPSTQGIIYGFRSLAPDNAGESPFSARQQDPSLEKVDIVYTSSDLCVQCNLTVEEDCVRLGTYQRWHSQCLQCSTCGRSAAVPAVKKSSSLKSPDSDKEKDDALVRRPQAKVGLFVYDAESMKDTRSFGKVPTDIFCTGHAHHGCRPGFQAVSQLEQYVFLLHVALRRLYTLSQRRGIVLMSAGSSTAPTMSPMARGFSEDPPLDSVDVNHVTSVPLKRTLSASVRIPRWSSVVGGLTGKSAHSPNVRTQAVMTAQSQRPPIQQVQRAQPEIRRPKSQSRPRSSQGLDNPPTAVDVDDGIPLVDIPQNNDPEAMQGRDGSLLRQGSVPYIAELTALELAIVKHNAVLALQRSPLRYQFDLDEILELVETRGSFWNRPFKPGNDKKNVKKKGVFGVPLEFLVEREGTNSLHGASRIALKVPTVVDDVVSAMRQMDMSVEGIFRKHGNIRRLKDLIEAIDRDPSSVDLTQDNPVQLAALLKTFLRDLPEPLMTYKLHRLFIASQALPDDVDRKRMLHMVSLILPKAHRDTMEVLFVFLKWVASFAHMDETGSRMDLQTLAAIICPSILYSRGRDSVRDDNFGAIRVVTSLLENQDEFHCVPEEFLAVLQDQAYFASSMDLPGKEFLQKCDDYSSRPGTTPA